ncbi:hypothetical protein AB205_0027190, partial [Aquarana catesbeiana]
MSDRKSQTEAFHRLFRLCVCLIGLPFLKIQTDLEIEHVLNISHGTNSYRENRSSVCCSDGPKTTHALKQVRDGSYWLLAIELPFSSPVLRVVRHLVLDGRTLARQLEWNSVGVPSEKPSEFIPTAKPVMCMWHNSYQLLRYQPHREYIGFSELAILLTAIVRRSSEVQMLCSTSKHGINSPYVMRKYGCSH